ncbi:MAG TPA: endonuclease domain-containing protein [Chitinophagaceae bacterium]|nr:endonuclease domain-containing protein [Chitinophagaceae bacterium]
MFYKADPLIFEKARELRNKLTHAEQTFWLLLKEHFPKYKFRRQHPLAIYVADFYCHKLRLVIEIDGSIHNSSEAKLDDEKRQKDLENLELTVIRFTNEQIRSEIEKVIDVISSTIGKLTINKESTT